MSQQGTRSGKRSGCPRFGMVSQDIVERSAFAPCPLICSGLALHAHRELIHNLLYAPMRLPAPFGQVKRSSQVCQKVRQVLLEEMGEGNMFLHLAPERVLPFLGKRSLKAGEV